MLKIDITWQIGWDFRDEIYKTLYTVYWLFWKMGNSEFSSIKL